MMGYNDASHPRANVEPPVPAGDYDSLNIKAD
jgi:hypothetical protein